MNKDLVKTDNAKAAEEQIPFSEFLEKGQIGLELPVKRLAAKEGIHNLYYISKPRIKIYCPKCDGSRSFDCFSDGLQFPSMNSGYHDYFMKYLCGDCKSYVKVYPLSIKIKWQDLPHGMATKYGEYPLFNEPISPRLMSLLGHEIENLKKAKRCEVLGMGIAAFAYYRRIIENEKNAIFDEIIGAVKTMGGSGELIVELEAAKNENQFTKGIDLVKHGLPQVLLLAGTHNPLTMLHKALSVGLHDKTDSDCLELARHIKVVLTTLAEKTFAVRQEDKHLKEAVAKLLAE